MTFSFIAAALVVLLIPGPGVLYVVTRGASQGRRAGIVSAVGLSSGALVHVVAATAGLSAILLASATAFGIVKMLGAGYLIYLGIRTLLSDRATTSTTNVPGVPTYRLFMDGVLVSVLNPKIAIFFLAFLPQFVDPDLGRVPQQVLRLGLIYVGLSLVTDSSYAVLAGSLRKWVGGQLTNGWLARYVSGSIYLGLGVNTALSANRE